MAAYDYHKSMNVFCSNLYKEIKGLDQKSTGIDKASAEMLKGNIKKGIFFQKKPTEEGQRALIKNIDNFITILDSKIASTSDNPVIKAMDNVAKKVFGKDYDKQELANQLKILEQNLINKTGIDPKMIPADRIVISEKTKDLLKSDSGSQSIQKAFESVMKTELSKFISGDPARLIYSDQYVILDHPGSQKNEYKDHYELNLRENKPYLDSHLDKVAENERPRVEGEWKFYNKFISFVETAYDKAEIHDVDLRNLLGELKEKLRPDHPSYKDADYTGSSGVPILKFYNALQSKAGHYNREQNMFVDKQVNQVITMISFTDQSLSTVQGQVTANMVTQLLPASYMDRLVFLPLSEKHNECKIDQLSVTMKHDHGMIFVKAPLLKGDFYGPLKIPANEVSIPYAFVIKTHSEVEFASTGKNASKLKEFTFEIILSNSITMAEMDDISQFMKELKNLGYKFTVRNDDNDVLKFTT